MEPDNLALDRYIVDLTGKSRPKVCFLPTASGDAELYIKNFYVAFTELDARPSCLSLFRPPATDLESFVLEKTVSKTARRCILSTANCTRWSVRRRTRRRIGWNIPAMRWSSAGWITAIWVGEAHSV